MVVEYPGLPKVLKIIHFNFRKNYLSYKYYYIFFYQICIGNGRMTLPTYIISVNLNTLKMPIFF